MSCCWEKWKYVWLVGHCVYWLWRNCFRRRLILYIGWRFRIYVNTSKNLGAWRILVNAVLWRGGTSSTYYLWISLIICSLGRRNNYWCQIAYKASCESKCICLAFWMRIMVYYYSVLSSCHKPIIIVRLKILCPPCLRVLVLFFITRCKYLSISLIH